MTEPTSTSDAQAAPGSRAVNQQKVIEERFSGLLSGTMLNIGSGQAPMLGEGWENVDNSPLAYAQHRFDLLGDWPLCDNTYDAITAIHVLEHFTGEELFHILWESGRVLKTGGCLAAVVPYGTSSYHYSNPFHKQMWTEDTPYHFNRSRYEQENTQSTHANQGQKMHVWKVSNMTFLPSPEWINKTSEEIEHAMKNYLNVILELSFAMTLEEK